MRPLLLILFLFFQLSWGIATASDFKAATRGFIENRGQIISTKNKPVPEVKFYTCSNGGVQVYFSPTRVSYVFQKTKAIKNTFSTKEQQPLSTGVDALPMDIYRMDVEFAGANPKAGINGYEQTEEITNYYLSYCPQGITRVPAFGKLIVKDLYPNIDLIWKITATGLKYEFAVHPGGNPSQIKMQYSGADTKLTAATVTATTPIGSLSDASPVSYQNNEKVQTEFNKSGRNIGFKLAEYNRSQTLVIDPMVVWGLYQNEVVASSGLLGMRVDLSGNVIITGRAPNNLFPTTVGVIQPVYAGNSDCYIEKFDKDGVRKWATYYGGSGVEPIVTPGLFTNCLALDANNNIVFVGSTASTDFPLLNATQKTYGGGTADMFIVKLFTADGTPEWSTYYGGSNDDQAFGATVDISGKVIVVGNSSSINFPTLGTVFQPASLSGSSTGVIVKLNPAGAAIWATFCGDITGSTGSDYLAAVTSDNAGNIYTTGSTTRTFPTTTGTFQPTNTATGRKITVSKLDQNGLQVWSTFHDRGIGNDIICDNSNLYVVGTSGFQGTFNVTPGFTSGVNGAADVCIFTLDNITGNRNANSWSRLFGGTGQPFTWQYGTIDYGMNIAFDGTGNLWVGGLAANSTDFPVTANTTSIQQAYSGGSTDGFFAKFDKTTGKDIYCSLFGSIDQDYGGYAFPFGSSNLFYGINSFNDGNAFSFPIPASRRLGTPYSIAITKICTTTGITADAGSDAVLCSGDTIRIGKAPVNGISYNWNTRTNLSDSTTANPKAFPRNTGLTPTTYKFNLLANDPAGCYGSDTIILTVKPEPTVTSATQPPQCQGTIGSYSLTGIYSAIKPDDTFNWEARGGNIIGDNTRQTVSVLWTNVGIDTVYMTVTNGFGCSARARILVDVSPLPSVDAGPDWEICEDSSIIPSALASGGIGALRYVWTPATGVSSVTDLRPTIKPSKQITDYVLTVTDSRGCIRSDTMQVRMNSKPIAFAGNDTVICRGESLQLNAIPSGGTAPYTVLWTPSGGLSSTSVSNPVLNILGNGKYVYHITDAKGCKAQDTINVQVVVKPTVTFNPPILDFGQLDGCTSSLEKTVTIINNSTGTGRITGASSDDASFSVTTGFPIDINASQNIDIKIKFSPVAEGGRNGIITLKGTPCGLSLPFQVKGDKVDIAVKNIPAGVDFGQNFTCSNRVSDTVITIYNTGNNVLNLGLPVILPPYSIVSPSFPQSVKIGDSINVVIRYAPVSDGNFSQTIRFPYSEGICNDEIKVSMNGISIPQNIRLTPATIQFQPLIDCELYRDTTITIENTSASDIQIDSSIGGGICRVVSPILPITLKSGEKQVIKVRTEPKNAGLFSSTLFLVYNPCIKKDSIKISGEKQGTSFVIADTVDVGEIIGCVKVFSTDSITLENTSTNGLDGSVISITSGNSITTSLTQGTVIPNKTSIKFGVTITPTKNGFFVDSMSIVLNPCGITKTVYFKGIRTDVVLRGDSLNVSFGKVKIGANVTKTIFFRNTGSTPLTITTISSIAAPFSIVDTVPSIPAVLQPNDTLKLTVNYKAIEGVQKTKVFAFGTTPCDASDSISVQGEGINDSTQTVIKIGDINIDVGDKVNLALILMKQIGLQQSGATKFTAKIRFNRHIVHVTDPSFTCLGGTPPEICEIPFAGDYQPGKDTLFIIPAEATLGDVESTSLELIDFKWLNGTVPVEVIPLNGEFKLNNICLAGGTRLFRSTAPVKLNATPNPSNGNVEIEYVLREKSAVKVSLTDILGRPVMTVEDAVHESGTYSKTIDISEKGDGIYFLTLQCPNVVKTIMMSVVK